MKQTRNKKGVLIQELDIIRKSNKNRLKPKAIVDFARKHKTSALHSRFEWQDTKAAEKYRLIQAQEIIRYTVIRVPQEDGEYLKTRAFVSLTPDRGKWGYRSIESVLGNENLKGQLFADALADMEKFQIKYAVLKKLNPVFRAMNRVKALKS